MVSYLVWALVALVTYSLVPPLVSYAIEEVPADVAALVTNGLLVVGIAAILIYDGQPVLTHLDTSDRALAMYLAGACLTVGIIAYYRALGAGPVSVVVPVFGMFLVGASVVGVLFFGESLTVRKVLGIVFASAAVYLVAVE